MLAAWARGTDGILSPYIEAQPLS